MINAIPFPYSIKSYPVFPAPYAFVQLQIAASGIRTGFQRCHWQSFYLAVF